MITIRQWWARMFPRHRMTPTQDEVKGNEQLYLQIPQELIESWLEQNNLKNPQSTDPYICVAWAARCDFVESVIKIRDRVMNPSKYQSMEQTTMVPQFDIRTRRAVNG